MPPTIDPPRAIRVKTSTGWADLAIRGPAGANGATGPTGPQGPTGATGAQGPAGQGVPAGGTAGQALLKASATDYATVWGTAGADLVYQGAFPAGTPYVDGEIVIGTDGIAYLCVAPTTADPAATPWPGGTWTPSGPPALTVSYSTSLPGSPYDGQEAILVDSLANPSYQLRFRYNAASGWPDKWEFIGGPPIRGGPAGSVTIGPASATATDITGGPTVTLPRAGVYRFAYGASIFNGGTFAGAYQSMVRLYTSGNTLVSAFGAELRHHGNTYDGACVVMHEEFSVAAATMLKLMLSMDRTGNNTTCSWCWIEATPIRVS